MQGRAARAIRSGRPPSAWLITGPPGIGKATLAYRIARYLLAHGAIEYLIVPGAVYGPAAVLAVFDLRRSRRNQSLAMPPPALRSA